MSHRGIRSTQGQRRQLRNFLVANARRKVRESQTFLDYKSKEVIYTGPDTFVSASLNCAVGCEPWILADVMEVFQGEVTQDPWGTGSLQ